MNILIYDDNQDDIKKLSTLLKDFSKMYDIPFYIQICPSKDFLFKQIDIFDFLFLDIELDNENGIEIGMKLNNLNHQCHIIITSSYKKYIIQGYRIHADRYFLKPLIPDEFHKEMKDEISWYYKKFDGIAIPQISNKKILFSDILYIDIYDRKSRIHFTNGRIQKCSYKMKEWEQQLKSELFYRTHKSYIVNLTYVNGSSSRDVFLINGEAIPISRNYIHDFQKKYIELLPRL